jgi:hypothetical protein
MDMIGAALGFAIVAMMVSMIALAAAAWALADMQGFKRSTHQVQFVSADQEKAELAEDKMLNRVLNDAEYRQMQMAYGNDREVEQ